MQLSSLQRLVLVLIGAQDDVAHRFMSSDLSKQMIDRPMKAHDMGNAAQADSCQRFIQLSSAVGLLDYKTCMFVSRSANGCCITTQHTIPAVLLICRCDRSYSWQTCGSR